MIISTTQCAVYMPYCLVYKSKPFSGFLEESFNFIIIKQMLKSSSSSTEIEPSSELVLELELEL
jgi:hypothetical protein